MTYALVAGVIVIAACVVLLLRQGYLKEQNKRLKDSFDSQQNLIKEQNEIRKSYDKRRASTPDNWDELRKKRSRALGVSDLQTYSSRVKRKHSTS